MTCTRCPSCKLMVAVVRDLGNGPLRIRAWRLAHHRPLPVPSDAVRMGYCPPIVLTPLGDREVCSV
jgi:hypothetical protein